MAETIQTPVSTENTKTTTENLNMRLGVKFTLLRTPLFAGVQKTTGDGYEVLLTPTDNIAGPGMTIEEMVNDINQLMGKEGALNAEDVQGQLRTLNPKSEVDFQNIRISLNQAFVHYKSTDSSVEYAISITVDAKELLPTNVGLINLEYMTLSVWNTTRPNVLTRMGLTSGVDLLGE